MSRAAKDVVQHVQINRHAHQQQLRGPDPRPQARRLSNDGYCSGAPALQYAPSPPLKAAAASLPLSQQQQQQQQQLQAGSGGGSGMASEADLYHQLKAKVEQQRVELNSRTDNVNAIQRNFQRLSEMYATDRQKLEDTERRLQAALEELQALRSEKKVLEALKREFTAMKNRCQLLEQEQSAVAGEAREELLAVRRELANVSAERDMLRQTVAECGDRIQDDDAQRELLGSATQQVEAEACALRDVIIALHQATSAALADSGIDKAGACALARCSPGCGDDGRRTLGERIQRVNGNLVESVKRGLYPLESTISAAFRQLRDASTAELQRVVGERDAANLEARRGREESAQLQAIIDDLSSKLREMATRLTSERAQFQQRLDEREAELSGVSGDADARLAEEKRTIEALQEELRCTSVKLRDSEVKCRAEEVRGAEAVAAAGRFERELDDARQQTTNQVRRAESAEARVVLLSTKLAALEGQHRDAMATAEQLHENELHFLRENLAKRPKQEEVDATVEALRAEVRALHAQLNDKNAQESTSLQDAIRVLSEKNALAMADLSKLAAERDTEHAALRSQLDVLEGEVKRLRESLASAEGEIERLTGERKEALTSLRAVEQRRLELEVSLKASQQEARASASASEKFRLMSDKNGALQTAIDGLHAELSVCKERLEIERQHGTELRAQKERAEMAARDAKRFADELVASQEAMLKQRADLDLHHEEARGRATQIRAVQEEVAKAVKKLINAEQACESGYSCQSCMELMRSPVMCGPCGHCFCQGCAPSKGSCCTECDTVVNVVVPVKNLDLLAGKFTYRIGVLNDLLGMVEKDLSRPLTII